MEFLLHLPAPFRFALRPRSADLPPVFVALAVALWMASLANWPLWRALADVQAAGSTVHGWGFLLGFGTLIAAGNAALLMLFAWRWTLKPVATVLLLIAAFGAYFMLNYGIAIDASMLTNVLQTDVREASDLLSWRMAAVVAALAGPPLWWLWRQPVARSSPLRQLIHNAGWLMFFLGIAVASVLVMFQEFSSTMRNQPQLRYLINPLNSVYALGRIATQPLRMDTHTLLPLGRDAHLGASYAHQTKPPLLVLVVGETGRSGNFGLNGYDRATTPQLSARSDLASAGNAWSCGTSTATALPCMFSGLGKAGYESRKGNHENLLDVLAHAGLAVLWLDNQSGCKGVCDRIASASTSASTNPDWCTGGECLDPVMLAGLDERLAGLPAEQRARGTVLVLHQMGSHGPAYARRSAPALKRFMPECQSNALQECSRQEVINAYDNSIVQTDAFLGATLQWLHGKESAFQPAMIYVADHGESLGENNIYLHGLPYTIAPDVQKHVPWITWLSPAMQARSGASIACLQKEMASRRISQDDYFHSVLGLLDVQTAAYQPANDLFAPCRAQG
jgi:lipid A ethanolaminephosphotransferase